MTRSNANIIADRARLSGPNVWTLELENTKHGFLSLIIFLFFANKGFELAEVTGL